MDCEWCRVRERPPGIARFRLTKRPSWDLCSSCISLSIFDTRLSKSIPYTEIMPTSKPVPPAPLPVERKVEKPLPLPSQDESDFAKRYPNN